ncbi:MAG TPA: ABC transporter ATP-binding protein [Oligoflexia bacterium]|nr:ABC transporter ATP-binding protein [Oligoflexia bacterium]
MKWGLEIAGISKKYQSSQNAAPSQGFALDQVHFSVNPGELVTLLGPSGSGKTTLLRIIAGLEIPTTGRVTLSHDANLVTFVDVEKDVYLEPFQRNVGMVFQSYALWPHRTVAENVAFPLEIQKIGRDERDKLIHEVLGRVELLGFEHRFPHELSGGQQQRVALARALVQRPRLLLLDEPLSNLDVALRASVRKEIKELNRKLGLTMIYVTHDRTEALELSDRMCIFDRGRLIQIGTPEEITAHPATDFVRQLVTS